MSGKSRAVEPGTSGSRGPSRASVEPSSSSSARTGAQDRAPPGIVDPPPAYDSDNFRRDPVALPGANRMRLNRKHCLHLDPTKHLYFIVHRPRAAEQDNELAVCVGDVISAIHANIAYIDGWVLASRQSDSGWVPRWCCILLTPEGARQYELAVLRPAYQENREKWEDLSPRDLYLIGAGQRERAHRLVQAEYDSASFRAEVSFWNPKDKDYVEDQLPTSQIPLRQSSRSPGSLKEVPPYS